MKTNPEINSPKNVPWRQNPIAVGQAKPAAGTVFSGSISNSEKPTAFVFPVGQSTAATRKNESVSRSQNFSSLGQNSNEVSEEIKKAGAAAAAEKSQAGLAGLVTQVKQGTSPLGGPLKSTMMKSQKKSATSSSLSLEKKKDGSFTNFKSEAKEVKPTAEVAVKQEK